jgi:hypothetical protein
MLIESSSIDHGHALGLLTILGTVHLTSLSPIRADTLSTELSLEILVT